MILSQDTLRSDTTQFNYEVLKISIKMLFNDLFSKWTIVIDHTIFPFLDLIMKLLYNNVIILTISTSYLSMITIILLDTNHQIEHDPKLSALFNELVYGMMRLSGLRHFD